MARTRPALTNFTAGEWSPQLYGRTDLQKYQNAARTLKGFVTRVHGGAQRRPGTYFVAEVKDSSKSTRLIPFEFSDTQAYVIEVGHQYMRFYKDYGQIVNPDDSPYEIVTPYLEEDLFGLRFVQDNDVMYIVHPDYEPRTLSRTGHTAWTLEKMTFIDGPYLDENDTDRTMAPSATTGSINIVTAGVSPAEFFTSGNVGQYIRILHNSTWGYARIDSITSPTQVAATVLSAFGGTGAVKTWRLGAFSPGEGYPSVIAFHEQRLVMGCTKGSPQYLWASKVGTDETFTPGADDADPWVYEIKSEKTQSLRWLAGMTNLMVGGQNGEWRVGSQDSASPTTPSNVKITSQGRHGSANMQAISLGSSLIFLEKLGKPTNNGEKVRELFYNWQTDSYGALDLTIFAEHITHGGIIDWDFQNAPFPILWAVRSDGTLVAMTFEKDQEVIGWHRHDSEDGDGWFESVAVIPGDFQDDVWVIVNRLVGDVEKRYVEYFMPFKFGTQNEAFFVDSGLTYDGGPEVDITGITKANPAVVTFDGIAPSNGQHVKIQGVVGMTEVNGRVFIVANVTGTTFELSGLDSTGYTAYVSGGTFAVVTNGVSGLSHLAGKNVIACVDGADVQDLVVALDGSVDLPSGIYGNLIHVGLPYTSELETMDLEGGTREGPRVGAQSMINGVSVRFLETLGGEIGQGDNLDPLEFDTADQGIGETPALYSGITRFPFQGEGWTNEPRVKIKTTAALPMTILAIQPTFGAEDF